MEGDTWVLDLWPPYQANDVLRAGRAAPPSRPNAPTSCCALDCGACDFRTVTYDMDHKDTAWLQSLLAADGSNRSKLSPDLFEKMIWLLEHHQQLKGQGNPLTQARVSRAGIS